MNKFNTIWQRNGKVRIKQRTNNDMFITEYTKAIYLWESINEFIIEINNSKFIC